LQEFKDKTAVVTGAASGIGRAMCEVFAEAGMKIVMADVEEPLLEEARSALADQGFDVCAVPTDVSEPGQVDALAARAKEQYGGVHVLCNNAGVFTGGLAWEVPVKEYDWLLRVNVWGVINGIRAFVPMMLEQDCEAHIVNTASMAAVTTMPYVGAYHMTKHAVLALSESLYHEVTLSGAKLKVSVLCPEEVSTRIGSAERNRPEELTEHGRYEESPERAAVFEAMKALEEGGVAPRVLAQRTLAGIREERFYILAEDKWREAANTRLEDVRQGRNPTFAPPV
jgi:NAD(P)-dependent dehydrogenase (short-subunit alcohol dehydrogenase family)